MFFLSGDSRSQPYLTAVIVLSCFVIIAIPCMSFLFWKLWRYFQDARDNTKAKKKDTEVYEEHYVPSIPRERGETLYFELRSRAPQGQVAAERHYEGLQHNDCPDYQNINDEKIYGVYDEIGKVRKFDLLRFDFLNYFFAVAVLPSVQKGNLFTSSI